MNCGIVPTNWRDGLLGTQDAEGKRHPLRTGAVGGVFATFVMTAFREPTARALPPTAVFVSRYRGGDPEEYPVTSLALHVLYGIGGGVGFGLAFESIVDDTDEPETVGLVAGVIYAILLSVFGERVVLDCLLDMDLSTDERAVFHAGHVVYGLALGAWVGSRS
ncbi:hypothetical protein [Halococcus agarilyticus]|uniref:hypothetical protein n=1 Tax=Halococcus agarilyticus TaxID=1232219 RepID=UPI001E3F3387|nr:hypothetical protein [Halococcus agarilyticus]